MKGVLVDTSVWVDHFRNRNDALIQLLAFDLVMMHPMVLGKSRVEHRQIALRPYLISKKLQQTQQASVREVMAFVERERVFGIGCGLVDLQLLASTMMTAGVELWTLDKRLSVLAERFGVMYRPVSN